MKDHVCTSCPSKFYSLPGHDPGGADTHCLPTACGKNERVYSNACTACDYDEFNFAGDLIVMGNTVCDDVDVCDDNHYVGYNYELHPNDQITNSAGYSDPITDFDKAIRLCNQNVYCTGVTQDEGLEQYYLSDGTKSFHADYTAYIKQETYRCHPCPPGGTRAGGDLANSETGLTTCTFDNCAANQYVSHYECKDCPAGTESPAANKDVIDSSCHPPACGLNEYVSDYLPDANKLYGGISCATVQDCKTGCTNNEDCEGYTEGEKIAAITPNAQEIYTAITEAGNLYIWGQDTTANLVDSSTPVKMDTGGPVKLAAATDDSICVVMADNKFKCIGDGTHGQLGNGGTSDSHSSFVDVVQGDLPSPPDQMDIIDLQTSSNYGLVY